MGIKQDTALGRQSYLQTEEEAAKSRYTVVGKHTKERGEGMEITLHLHSEY